MFQETLKLLRGRERRGVLIVIGNNFKIHHTILIGREGRGAFKNAGRGAFKNAETIP